MLELLVVIVIIGLLVALVMPMAGIFKAKASNAACVGNMRALHSGFQTYLGDHQLVWPQVPDGLPRNGDQGDMLAKFWHDQLKDYGIAKKNWICAADEELHKHIDESDVFYSTYTISEFDEQPNRAYQWPNQPWIIESGELHGRGKGPNMIFPDGRIERGMSLMLNLPQ